MSGADYKVQNSQPECRSFWTVDSGLSINRVCVNRNARISRGTVGRMEKYTERCRGPLTVQFLAEEREEMREVELLWTLGQHLFDHLRVGLPTCPHTTHQHTYITV